MLSMRNFRARQAIETRARNRPPPPGWITSPSVASAAAAAAAAAAASAAVRRRQGTLYGPRGRRNRDRTTANPLMEKEFGSVRQTVKKKNVTL